MPEDDGKRPSEGIFASRSRWVLSAFHDVAVRHEFICRRSAGLPAAVWSQTDRVAGLDAVFVPDQQGPSPAH